jgi:RNA polymerase sigma factor (sigma-70 family)
MSDVHPPSSQEGEEGVEGIERPMTPEVVAALVENHRDFLHFLERRVGSREVAEDILQDAFLRGLDRLDTVRNEDSATAWFYRTLRNAVVDHFRRRGARERMHERVAAEFPEAAAPDAETQEMVCRCVVRLAETLKPEYSAALRRVEVDGLSVQAFAEEAHITPGNAAVRLFRAREALRQRVRTSCGTCAAHGCLDCSCDMAPRPLA